MLFKRIVGFLYFSFRLVMYVYQVFFRAKIFDHDKRLRITMKQRNFKKI